MQSLVDVKSRLEKFNQKQDGRVKLVKEVLKEEPEEVKEAPADHPVPKAEEEEGKPKSEIQDLAAIDKRLGEIEQLVGSATASLDEVR